LVRYLHDTRQCNTDTHRDLYYTETQTHTDVGMMKLYPPSWPDWTQPKQV